MSEYQLENAISHLVLDNLFTKPVSQWIVDNTVESAKNDKIPGFSKGISIFRALDYHEQEVKDLVGEIGDFLKAITGKATAIDEVAVKLAAVVKDVLPLALSPSRLLGAILAIARWVIRRFEAILISSIVGKAIIKPLVWLLQTVYKVIKAIVGLFTGNSGSALRSILKAVK